MDDVLVLAGIAPRAFLELRGDPIEPDRLEEIAATARARYAAPGVPERFEYVAYAGRHAFPEPMRERAYAWLDRWLEDKRPLSDGVP